MTDTIPEQLKSSLDAVAERPQAPTPRVREDWELRRERQVAFDNEVEEFAAANHLTTQEATLAVTRRKKSAELQPAAVEKIEADNANLSREQEAIEQRRIQADAITAQWSGMVDKRTELVRKIAAIKDLMVTLGGMVEAFQSGGADALINQTWSTAQMLEQLSHAGGAQLGVATLTAALPIKEKELAAHDAAMRALGKLHNIPRNFWP